jgi:hypothetical protein
MFCVRLARKNKRKMARQEGVEPPTAWFVARYSIQLSYWRAVASIITISHCCVKSNNKLFKVIIIMPVFLSQA